MKTLLSASFGTERSRLYGMLLIVAGVFLIFFEVPLAFNVREIIDDTCYLSWLHRFLLIPDASCPNPYHFPGVAALWIPAGIAGRIGAFLFKSDSAHWISTFIGLTSYTCWAMSLVLVDRIVMELGAIRLRSILWVAAFLLAVPVLHYATARCTMAHSGEIFLALLTIYLAIKRRYTASLLFAFWLCATRVNDAPILLVVFARIWDERSQRIGGITRAQKRWAVGALLSSLIALIIIGNTVIFHNYGGVPSTGIITILRGVTGHELNRVLWGDSWGLIFTAPFWLLCLGSAPFFFTRLSWMARACWLWMLITFIVCVGWNGMGNSFGYRYSIGSYAATLILWLEVLPMLSRTWDRVLKVCLIAEAVWLTHLTWVYDHFSSYWEVLTHWKGLISFKDLVYPITRFGLSPLGILVKSLLYPVTRVEKFTGPFHSHLGRTALWINGILTILAIATTAFSMLNLRKQRSFFAPSIQDRSPFSSLGVGLFLLHGKQRKS